MRTNVVALPENIAAEELGRRVESSHGTQHLYPVIGRSGDLAGVATRKDIQRIQERILTLREAMQKKVVTAFPDEPLRLVVYRMAETGLTRMPVVERDNPAKLVGMISLTDLLLARTRNLEEERHRERVLRLNFIPRRRHSLNKRSAVTVSSGAQTP